jgi:hypothetical protein
LEHKTFHLRCQLQFPVKDKRRETKILTSRPKAPSAQRRRADGFLTDDKQNIRTDILAGLIADKGGVNQIGTAERILAEIMWLLVTFNQAIEGVIKNNQEARQNPKALAQLEGYKRPLVGSLSANLQRFGMEKVAKMESLQEIIADMGKIRR